MTLTIGHVEKKIYAVYAGNDARYTGLYIQCLVYIGTMSLTGDKFKAWMLANNTQPKKR